MERLASRIVSLALGAGALALVVVLMLFAHPVETAEARASAVAQRFFTAMTTRHWDTACEMLSEDFYARNNLTNDRACFMALHLGFTLREDIRFEVRGVERRGDDVLVYAVADGAPGAVRLVPDHGTYRIDSLLGD